MSREHLQVFSYVHAHHHIHAHRHIMTIAITVKKGYDCTQELAQEYPHPIIVNLNSHHY